LLIDEISERLTTGSTLYKPKITVFLLGSAARGGAGKEPRSVNAQYMGKEQFAV
jgi:predicted nucleotidyltransferase